MNDAKQKLALVTQSSGVEEKRISEEYEKKKKATIKNVQSLEKEIKPKKVDGSIDARKAAIKALANAVKALTERNTVPS